MRSAGANPLAPSPCGRYGMAGQRLSHAKTVRTKCGPFSFALVDLAIFARYVPTTARSAPGSAGTPMPARVARETRLQGFCENAERDLFWAPSGSGRLSTTVNRDARR